MRFILDSIKDFAEYAALEDSLRRQLFPSAVTGLSHIHKAAVFAALVKNLGLKGLLITPAEAEALSLAEDLRALGMNALFYPARDFVFRDISGVSREYEHTRLDTLRRISEGNFDICTASVSAALQYTLPPDVLASRAFSIDYNSEIDISALSVRLTESGYKKCEQVEGAGQFAVRGGIIDIFTPGMKCPVRIELWGEAVDSISLFDTESQRRTENTDSVRISPAREVLTGAEELASRLESFAAGLKSGSFARRECEKCAELARAGVLPVSLDRFIPVIYEKPATLLDYTDALTAVSESTGVKESCRAFQWQLEQDTVSLLEEGLMLPGKCEFAMTWDGFLHSLSRRRTVVMDTFPKGRYEINPQSLHSFTMRQSPPWNGSLNTLTEDVSDAVRSNVPCAVLAGTAKACKTLAGDLSRAGIPAIFSENPGKIQPGTVAVVPGGLSGGFELPGVLSVITGGRRPPEKRSFKKKRDGTKDIGSIEEISRGDYIVHVSHGIGVYDGVEKKTAGGVTKDYIKIKYAGGDVLYVPVTQLDLVSKYIGSAGDGQVKLNRLGGTEWLKTKRRVKSAVKDLAKQLTALYAKRMQAKGYAFGEDTDMQNDFERRFEHEETDDQLRCVSEIKRDMERVVPMDRLLCGDVGFGKTEVALRAAFKCVLDSKQCAILVPTTILALQHYQTVTRRMQGMPVNIELLSRFRTPAQQRETVKRIKSGEADIVIGTHRLVSKDVVFKDLGLLIVDEEQRFGVAQKEKLKESFPSVDVLTLSATPIPRTLNMAMSGLRDMSVIEEAPQDRYPVQTYVLEYDSGIVLDAIRRELRRGGQVYYIHNDIETIEGTAARLASRLEGASVAVAHGRMSEDELSEAWRRIIDRETDVLVCTTIIETGIDVPNVNTLIIENADRFGLAQLHQLRGRVGRSSRRAYAYLTFRRGKALSEVAYKRLEAIREYTEFGSGFKIAMRDLEIRGAGSILGGEQHGHMESVGYDMYIKLLSEAVAEESGGAPPSEAECAVDLQIEAHIPEAYIPSQAQRISVYRRIAGIRTAEDAEDVADELTDRFGDIPASVQGLVDIALLRSRAARLGISDIVQKGGAMLFYPTAFNMEEASALVSAMRHRVMVSAGRRPYISVKMRDEKAPLAAIDETLTALAAVRESLPDTAAAR